MLMESIVQLKTPHEFAFECMQTDAQRVIDKIEDISDQLPQVDCPLNHFFYPGLYVKERRFPAGILVTTPVHTEEHPYTIVSGTAVVWIEGVGCKKLIGPHNGVTKPGTRRLILCETDVVWMTFHPNPTDIRDLEELDKRLFYHWKEERRKINQLALKEQTDQNESAV